MAKAPLRFGKPYVAPACAHRLHDHAPEEMLTLLTATKDIDISEAAVLAKLVLSARFGRTIEGVRLKPGRGAMSERLYDFFGEIFQRYFRLAIDAYPRTGGALVERWLTLTDDVPDRLAESRRAAMAWGKAETPNATITSETFVITQHGLMYAAGLSESRRALYYLATPPALFDPFVDQVETAELRDGAVVVVDSRCGRDLVSAHPMDAALRRILDEHLALRVDRLA
jgi:hypothetical protein